MFEEDWLLSCVSIDTSQRGSRKLLHTSCFACSILSIWPMRELDHVLTNPRQRCDTCICSHAWLRTLHLNPSWIHRSKLQSHPSCICESLCSIGWNLRTKSIISQFLYNREFSGSRSPFPVLKIPVCIKVKAEFLVASSELQEASCFFGKLVFPTTKSTMKRLPFELELSEVDVMLKLL